MVRELSCYFSSVLYLGSPVYLLSHRLCLPIMSLVCPEVPFNAFYILPHASNGIRPAPPLTS